MPRFMLITYVFPPAGGAGVQRALKLAKYIGGHGWEPVVLTPRNLSVPVIDASYEKELPPGLMVERPVSLEPPVAAGAGGGGEGGGGLRALVAGLLFPDRHVLWLPTALSGAIAAARRHRVKAVVVTGPPFSTFILGWAVSRALGIPLILDFRDDWSGFFSQGWSARGGGALWKRLVLSLERRLVRAARMVVATTPDINRRLQRLHGGADDRYVWIPNGYDPADFAFLGREHLSPPDDGRLHLLYAGTVFQSHPLDGLWAGLERLTVEQRRRVALSVVGRAAAGQVLDPGLPGLDVAVHPYEPHDQVLRRMAQSHAMVMTLAAIPGLERMVPAKLFEHMAVRRATLALVPPGPAWGMVEEAAAGAALAPDDAEGLARVLEDWIAAPPGPLGPPPEVYDRSRLAGLWARALERAAGR